MMQIVAMMQDGEQASGQPASVPTVPSGVQVPKPNEVSRERSEATEMRFVLLCVHRTVWYLVAQDVSMDNPDSQPSTPSDTQTKKGDKQKKEKESKEKKEDDSMGQPPSASTSAVTASPAGPSSSTSSSQPAERHTLILEYVRFLVRNLVPISSPLFQPTNPAELLHDTTFAEPFPMYRRPFQLVWLYDINASNQRATLSDTASYQRLMPSLPHWLMSSDGHDDCIPRSLMLADVGASLAGTEAEDWKQAMFELPRSRVTGSALDKDKEALILDGYRNRSAFASPRRVEHLYCLLFAHLLLLSVCCS